MNGIAAIAASSNGGLLTGLHGHRRREVARARGEERHSRWSRRRGGKRNACSGGAVTSKSVRVRTARRALGTGVSVLAQCRRGAGEPRRGCGTAYIVLPSRPPSTMYGGGATRSAIREHASGRAARELIEVGPGRVWPALRSPLQLVSNAIGLSSIGGREERRVSDRRHLT